MKPIYLVVLFLIGNISAKAQVNYVPDGDFENYSICPTGWGAISSSNTWDDYTLGSSDLYNSCYPIISLPTPDHGDGMSGIIIHGTSSGVDYREYIHSEILPMLINVRHEVSFSIRLISSCNYGTDGIGAYFYDNGPATYHTATTGVLPVTPQVNYDSYGPIVNQNSWLRVTQYFFPDSAYDNIVIGGFKSNANCTKSIINPPGFGNGVYYYIDSVVVRPVGNVTIDLYGNGFCAGDTIDVPYTVQTSNYFSSANVFTVELSTSTSFASPIAIGSVTSNTSGVIQCVIPASAVGTSYRMRIKSSAAPDASYDNGIDIRITQPSAVIATTNSPVCVGEDITISTSALTGASYAWQGPNSFSAQTNNASLTATSVTNSGDYVLTRTYYGCVAKDTVTVLVKPLPIALASSNTPVCPGNSIQLSTTSNPAGTTYSWTGPSGYTSSTQNPSILSAAAANSGIYEVIAVLAGCSDTANTTVDVYITTATPVAGIANNPACEGFPLNLTATCATPGVSYNWTGPIGYTSNQQNPSDPALISYHNGDFIVHATVNGCVSLPDTVNVQVYPKPYLGNYASPNDTVCEGTVVTFVTVPMSGVINPTFQWFKNNVPVAGATNLTLIAPYTTGDTFYCRTYCQNQCGDNLTLYSNKVGMTVMPIVTDLSVSLSSVPAQALPGNPVTFMATVSGGGYSPAYQWKKNGVAINNAIYAIYSANNLSPYDEIVCCVVSSDPCAIPTTACSDAMVINFPTSVGEAINDDGITLYPNPNEGNFKVKSQKSKIKSIEVMNVAGQVVYEAKPAIPQTEYIINLPQQLPAGTYMLRAYSSERVYRTVFTLNR